MPYTIQPLRGSHIFGIMKKKVGETKTHPGGLAQFLQMYISPFTLPSILSHVGQIRLAHRDYTYAYTLYDVTVHTLILLGEIIFDRTHPGFPPDVIFSTGDELMEFEPNIDQLEVSQWNYVYPMSLLLSQVCPVSPYYCCVVFLFPNSCTEFCN